MIKEFENKKAGLGNKLKFILTAQNGSQFDFEHTKDMDEILKGQCNHFFIRECNDVTLDMSNDSNERKVLRSVFPLPCSSSSFPIQSLSVKVETDCDQSKNMFARFFSGACGSSRNSFIVMIKSSAFQVPSQSVPEIGGNRADT